MPDASCPPHPATRPTETTALRGVHPARRRRRLASVLLGALLALAAVLPAPAAAAVTWRLSLWAGESWVYQDPYMTACTAATTMSMLNLTARAGTGGPDFTWSPYRVKNNTADAGDYRDLTSILYFARSKDTIAASSAGSDAHGWRNALNYYGWGWDAMVDPDRRVYDDLAFADFDTAVKAAVQAMARYRMPVGVLAWAGGHAQVLTGFEATGDNPALSTDFTVDAIYLADPLRNAGMAHARISLTSFRTGPTAYRFVAYRETDSIYDDPYTPGWIRSSVAPSVGPSEWYGKFVIVAPVRGFVPMQIPQRPPVSSPGSAAAPVPAPSPVLVAAPRRSLLAP